MDVTEGVAQADSPSAPRRRRVVALDAARALAIIGMLVVNVGPTNGEGPAAAVIRIPHGRASLLFVLLAGIGLSLLTRRAREPGGRLDWLSVLWRAALLLLIGLAAQLLDHDLNVILPTYAVLFGLALLFARASSVVVLCASLVFTIGGPLVWLSIQVSTGTTFEMAPAGLLDHPGQIVASTVLTGPYPVLTWAAPFLFGMWLGRQDLLRRRTQIALIVGGLGLAAVAELISETAVLLWGEPGEEPGFDLLLTSVAHSQMPLWLIGGTGAAAFVLGLCLLVVPRLGRWAHPLLATGQLALTIYLLHMVLIAEFVRPGPEAAVTGLAVTAVLTVILVLFAVTWRAWLPRGPLEAALRLPRGLVR